MLVAAQIVAVGLGPDWRIQMLNFILMGWGFYMLHGCLQVFASELSRAGAGDGFVAAFVLLLHGADGRSDRLWSWPFLGRETSDACCKRRRHHDSRIVCARLLTAEGCSRRIERLSRSASSAIGRDALIGNPDALGQPPGLPEYVDGNTAARIPVAADAQPFRLDRAAIRLPIATVQSSWKAP